MDISMIKPEDAAAYACLLKQLEKESDYLLYGPNERDMSEKKAKDIIESIVMQSNSTIMVAKQDGRIAGHLTCMGGKSKRNQHNVYLVIGVRKEKQGQGIAKKMFKEIEQWASDHGIHRLELTVMAHNHRAIHLYKKMGFQIEGTKQHALQVNRKWVDEYLMAKLLPVKKYKC